MRFCFSIFLPLPLLALSLILMTSGCGTKDPSSLSEKEAAENPAFAAATSEAAKLAAATQAGSATTQAPTNPSSPSINIPPSINGTASGRPRAINVKLAPVAKPATTTQADSATTQAPTSPSSPSINIPPSINGTASGRPRAINVKLAPVAKPTPPSTTAAPVSKIQKDIPVEAEINEAKAEKEAKTAKEAKALKKGQEAASKSTELVQEKPTPFSIFPKKTIPLSANDRILASAAWPVSVALQTFIIQLEPIDKKKKDLGAEANQVGDILAAPQVTTAPFSNARMEIVESIPFPDHHVWQRGKSGKMELTPKTMRSVDTGICLDLLPKLVGALPHMSVNDLLRHPVMVQMQLSLTDFESWDDLEFQGGSIRRPLFSQRIFEKEFALPLGKRIEIARWTKREAKEPGKKDGLFGKAKYVNRTYLAVVEGVLLDRSGRPIPVPE